jgi:hypothetical protein
MYVISHPLYFQSFLMLVKVHQSSCIYATLIIFFHDCWSFTCQILKLWYPLKLLLFFFLLCCLVDLSFNYCFSKFIKALAFMQPQIFFSWLLKSYMSNFEVFPWSSKFCVSNFEVVISIEASSILFLLCCVVDLSFN